MPRQRVDIIQNQNRLGRRRQHADDATPFPFLPLGQQSKPAEVRSSEQRQVRGDALPIHRGEEVSQLQQAYPRKDKARQRKEPTACFSAAFKEQHGTRQGSDSRHHSGLKKIVDVAAGSQA